MGVRVEANVTTAAKGAARKGAGQAAGKPGDLTEGLPSDFGQELERARPRKPKADVEREIAPVSDKPAGKTEKKAAKGKTADRAGEAELVPAGQQAEAKDTEIATPPESLVEGEIVTVDGEDVVDGGQDDGAESIDERLMAERLASELGTAQAPVEVAPAVEDEVPTPIEGDAPVNAAALEPVAMMGRPVDPGMQVDPRDGGDAPPVDDETTAVPVAAEMKPTVRPMQQQGQGEERQQDGERGQVTTAEQIVEGEGTEQATPDGRFAELFDAMTDPEPTGEAGRGVDQMKPTMQQPTVEAVTLTGAQQPSGGASEVRSVQSQPVPAAPEARFVEQNHPKVVTAAKTQLLPGGGSIVLRLDPPDLGPLRLEVKMDGAAMSASFVAAGDRAAGLLTQTLGDLKVALEGAGITVDKLQVRQGGAEQFSQDSDQRQQQAGEQSSARQDQQRREMLERMWRKVAGGDPVDLLA